MNTISTPSNITFELPFSVNATATSQVLTGAETDSNTPTAPDTVLPQTGTVDVGETFSYDAPGFSVSVLTLTVA